MSKFLKVTGINDVTPSGLDGHRYRLTFQVGDKEGDTFVPQSNHAVDVEASRTLQAVWNQSNKEIQVSSASTATSQILALASEHRLQELPTMFRLNTYSAPKEPPTAPIIDVGALFPIAETMHPVPTGKFSFLSEDISELRDQINALAKDIWGDRILLLSQERPLLDMYKPVRNIEEFRARTQALGIIVKDVNKAVLGKVGGLGETESVGEIVLLQRALETLVSADKIRGACEILKAINSLRQGYPTHGDNAKKFLDAHRFFKLPYPIADHEGAWESVLGEYFRAMKEIRDCLSEGWSRNAAQLGAGGDASQAPRS